MKKVNCLLCAAVMFVVFSLTGCGNSGQNTIKFFAYGDEGTLTAYSKMVDGFNNSIGKEKGIIVKYTPYPESDYESKIEQSAKSKSGPDVFVVKEKLFKKWAMLDYLEPLDSYIASGTLALDNMWEETVSRYRYNVENNTSNNEDPLYSVPVDASPTALYYNRDVMEELGVTVIGVSEEQLDDWNSGLIADKYGNKKSDFPKLSGINIPAKGYFRSENQYLSERDNGRWIKPSSDTVLVFNDEIAMNWDETEDLAMLMTKTRNADAPTKYGYYTEWWFNYGWSVGGDCIADLSGNGDWTFTLGDWTYNYIVMPGKTYTGEYTSRVYTEGETLELVDKLACEKDSVLTADDKGGFKVNGNSLGNSSDPQSAIRPSVVSAAEQGTLGRLPSTKTAFTRFAKLAGSTGDLNICPYPDEFDTTSSFSYFVSGNVGMIIEQALYIAEATDMANFTWGVAPLPQYKEYSSDDPFDDDVAVEGIASGHSNSTSVSIRKGSLKKEAAYTFIEYLCGEEGQKIKADMGFVPNQVALTETEEYKENNYTHINIFLRAMNNQRAGDWWYMADDRWISIWADPLNGKVRNGTLTLSAWFDTYISQTNAILKEY